MFKRRGTIVYQQFMKFFFPTVMMNVALSLSIVVDGMIVGNILGTEALAAVNLVLPITLLMNSLYVLLGVGGSTLYSIELGKRDKKRAKELFTLSVISMVIASGLLSIVGLFLCGTLAELLTVKAPNLTGLVYNYMKIVMFAAPLLVIVPGFVYFLRSIGQVKLASSILIIANIVNLCLDILFIVGFKMGIRGAAIATATGYIVGLLVALYGIMKTKELRFCKIRKEVGKSLCLIAKTGLPSTIHTALNFFRLTSINAIVMIYLGSDGVTAFSVCTSCLSIVSMFVGGSAQTMVPLLGTFYGERDFASIRFTIKKAFLITCTATLILLFIFEIIPVQLTGLFGVDKPEQIAIAVAAIRIYALSLPFMGILFLFMCIYQVLKRQTISSVIALLEGFAIVVPAAWILSKLFGPVGIWIAFPIGEIVSLLLMALTIVIVKRKSPKAQGMFLIEENSGEVELDVTMIQNIYQAAELSEATIQFCKKNNIPKVIASKVGVALEEMTVNTINKQKKNKKGKNKKCIDVRVLIKEKQITIIFKDNGTPLDPLKNQGEKFGNIATALALASDIQYDYILGMNCSTVTMELKEE